jgi:hypothetical protein
LKGLTIHLVLLVKRGRVHMEKMLLAAALPLDRSRNNL